MTINQLATILFRLVLFPTILYWILPLYVFNHSLNTFEVLGSESTLFKISFISFMVTIGLYFIFFIMYLVANKNKSVVIVLAPSYIANNFWKDLKSL